MMSQRDELADDKYSKDVPYIVEKISKTYAKYM